jgi:hypothetical protein
MGWSIYLASPPVDPVVRLPADDAYRISGRDMTILKDALHYKMRNETLLAEIVSLRQLLDECGCDG